MEIRQLEAFAAVMAAGSVTAAGRLLDRSQPVVSRQVQELEQALGFKLFTRTRPQVTLTEQGRAFYQEVRPLLVNLEMLEVRALEIARGGLRPLRMAATRSLSVGLLPAVLGLMEKDEPAFKQKLSLETVGAEQIITLIQEGKIDLGVTSLPLDTDTCAVQWSGQAPMLLAMHISHPLASQELLRLADLEDTVLISIVNRYGLRHQQATALVRANMAPADRVRHIEVTTAADALVLVAKNVGVALVDPFTAQGLPLTDVVFKPVDMYIPYMMGVLSMQGRPLREDALRLVEFMRYYVAEHIPRFVFGDDSGLPSSQDPFGSQDNETAG